LNPPFWLDKEKSLPRKLFSNPISLTFDADSALRTIVNNFDDRDADGKRRGRGG